MKEENKKEQDPEMNQNTGENEEMNEVENQEAEVIEDDAPENDPSKKIDELNDKYLRLYSEFDNYRKRTAREKIDIIQTAGGDIIKELLPVLDDFERAIKSNEKIDDSEKLKEGFELIHHKLLHNLQRKGLTMMEAMGAPFDPEIHEAITKIPSPSPELKGKVVDVAEAGYYLNGKVLRYAKVVVGE